MELKGEYSTPHPAPAGRPRFAPDRPFAYDEQWRRGDAQPFAFDGRPTEREATDPLKTSRVPRVERVTTGDSRPLTLSALALSPRYAPGNSHVADVDRLVAAATGAGGGCSLMPKALKQGVRGWRASDEKEASVQRLQELTPALWESIQLMRRGECRF